MRLPTSWELCRPVGAPASGYVLSATLLSGPSPIRGCLVPSNSAAAKAIWLSVLGPLAGSELLFFLGRHQVDTRSQFMGAPVPAELPAQPPADGAAGRGGRGASGPTPLRPIAGCHEGNRRTEIRRAERMRLAQTSGEACLSAAAGGAVRKLDVAFLLVGPLRVAGARCHLWVYRAVYGRWPPSMRSGNRLSRRILPPPLFFECGSYPRRKGAVRCKAGELQVRARPRVGWARPASGCFSHGHTPSGPAAIAQRTTSRRAVGGRRASGAATIG